jgi:hypothetical protein
VIPRYTLGLVAGTIGPYCAGEPKHFVIGRQMVAATAPTNPTAAAHGVYSFQCKLHPERKVLTADFGNCLQIVSADSGFADIGTLTMAVLKTDTDAPVATVTADQVVVLGVVGYRQPGWYAETAGVQDFDYSADAWAVANIASHPLLLLGPESATSYKVLVQESLGVLYLRADDFVARLEPGATAAFDLYASRYGERLQATIELDENTGAMGGTGGGDEPLHPPVPTPDIATPSDAISYGKTLPTDPVGKATLAVNARPAGAGNPRGYIDGQLYGIGYRIAGQPPETLPNFWNFISILAFDKVDVPAAPTWYSDVQPILTQYGNLYPIMSKHLVDLGDYDSVVAHLDILVLAFALPVADPNHMPVTRDLSEGRRRLLLKWMSEPGPDGLPLKGEPVVAVAAAAPRAAVAQPAPLGLDPRDSMGKTAVILAYEARMKGEEPS